jgi:GxxExxY protein
MKRREGGAELMDENAIGTALLGSAIRVHSKLGPGLLESAYEACLAHELRKMNLAVREQVSIPIHYDGIDIDNGYRADLVVGELVVVELKAMEGILPIHKYQLLTYLRLGDFKLGYLLNFNVPQMRNGIVRLVNGL